MESSRIIASPSLTGLPLELLFMLTNHLSAKEIAAVSLVNTELQKRLNVFIKLALFQEAAAIKKIKADESQLIVELMDGRVFSKEWEGDGFKLIYQLSPGEQFVAVEDSYFAWKDGKVKAWGNNEERQLGLSKDKYIDEPTPLNIEGYVVEVIPAGNCTYFLMADKTVKGCGSNDHGKLGMRQETIIPITTLPLLSGIVKVSASKDAYCALFLHEDGTVSACGGNTWGQLGLGHKEDVLVATKNPQLTNIRDVVAGMAAFFIHTNDTVQSCGFNKYNNLGYRVAEGEEVTTPRLLAKMANVRTIATSMLGTAFVLRDGSALYVGMRDKVLYSWPMHLAVNVQDVAIETIVPKIDELHLLLILQDPANFVAVLSNLNPFAHPAPLSDIDIFFAQLNEKTLLARKHCQTEFFLNELLEKVTHKQEGKVYLGAVLSLLQREAAIPLTSKMIKMLSASPWLDQSDIANVLPEFDSLAAFVCSHEVEEAEAMLAAYQKLLPMIKWLDNDCAAKMLPYKKLAHTDFHQMIDKLINDEFAGQSDLDKFIKKTSHLSLQHTYRVGQLRLFNYDCSFSPLYLSHRANLAGLPVAALKSAASILLPGLTLHLQVQRHFA